VKDLRRQLPEGLQREMLGIARGQRRAQQTGPQHHVAQELVQPDYAGMKENSQ